jgi:hypothetical protein
MAEIPERQKFLFLFPVEGVSKKCCCGCSLRIGIAILAILTLTSNIYLLIHNIGMITKHTEAIIYLLSDLVAIIASIFLLVSIKNENYKYAQYAYLIMAILFYIELILIIYRMIFIFFNPYLYSHNISVFLIACGIILSIFSIKLYLLWTIFSYTKLLKYKQTDVVKGRDPNQIDDSYRNVGTATSYSNI